MTCKLAVLTSARLWRLYRSPGSVSSLLHHICTAAMSADERPAASQTYPKTHAKSVFCLSDKDLETLPIKEKRNPYVRRGPPMKLYFQTDVSLPTCAHADLDIFLNAASCYRSLSRHGRNIYR